MAETAIEDRLVGGLRCSEVLERLSDHVDGALDAGARAAVQAHLAGCTNCTRFGDTFVRMLAAVRRSADDEPVEDAAFVDAVLSRLGG